jgi:signal transduction histidine kinase
MRSHVRSLAWGLTTLALALTAATVTFVILNGSSIHSSGDVNPIEVTVAFTFAIVGGLIALRLPRNPMGWIFLSLAVIEGFAGLASQYSLLGLVTSPGSVPAARWVAWLYGWLSVLVYPSGLAAWAFLLLPDGHLPSRRWRPVMVIAIVLTLLVAPLTALSPGTLTTGSSALPPISNPAGLSALNAFNSSAVWSPLTIAFIVGVLVLLISASAPVVRMRHSRGEERQQLKWIAYTAIAATVLNLFSVVATLLLPSAFQSELFWLIPIAAGYGVALPVTFAIAILKYRLYDLDIVISRALVYGALAVFITAVYVGIAVGIGALIGGGGKPNLGLSILATAIVALGFQPVRERLHKVANRLVYGKRATPYEVLSEFSGRVAETYAAEDVLPRMARVLQEGTGAQSAVVWLRRGEQMRPAASHPPETDVLAPLRMTGDALPDIPADRVVAVEHQGELLGALSVTKRRGESLTPLEAKLLDDLAHQAGLVIKNVGLTSQLMQRLEELRTSRQRLVQAQDEERRRLERNLHDGAQQHLVALKVKLGLVETLAAKDPAKANAMLEQLKSDTDDALETLRDLARGIYPPLLADKGLGTALAAHARKAAVPVTVEADGIGRYSPDVEATVYFCVLEALQNVQKYAQASRATVRLGEQSGALKFVVEDDGQGFDPSTAKKGAGLTNMADRLDAAGGSLDVASNPGNGTRVCGTLPVQVLVPA